MKKPKYWTIRHFKSMARLVRETVNPIYVHDLPYIGLEHIGEGTLHLIRFGLASEVMSSKLYFQKGDILFGKLRPYFRKILIAPFDGVCSTDIWVIRPNEDIDPKFLFYLMASDFFVEPITRSSEGTKMPRAKWEFAENLHFLIPPLAEQRAIAHILGTLDDKIDLNRRMSATLEAMARALFRAWFIDFEPVRAKQSGRWRRGESLPGLPAALFDRFPDRLVPSELGEIPEGWGVIALRELLELAYGKALKEEKRKIGDVAVYGSNGRVGWHNEALVRGPGIVVGRKGNPGTVTWAPSDFFVIDTAFYVLPKKLCQSLYFLFFALSNQDFALLATDSAVPGLNRNFVYQNLQVFPSLQVIKIFDQIVETIFLQLYQLDRESRTLSALRDALLPKLISGALRVADAERFLRERGVG